MRSNLLPCIQHRRNNSIVRYHRLGTGHIQTIKVTMLQLASPMYRHSLEIEQTFRR